MLLAYQLPKSTNLHDPILKSSAILHPVEILISKFKTKTAAHLIILILKAREEHAAGATPFLNPQVRGESLVCYPGSAEE